MSCSDHVHLILRLHAPPRNLGMSCSDHVHLILRLHAPPWNLYNVSISISVRVQVFKVIDY